MAPAEIPDGYVWTNATQSMRVALPRRIGPGRWRALFDRTPVYGG
jgi:hypothetical protein